MIRCDKCKEFHRELHFSPWSLWNVLCDDCLQELEAPEPITSHTPTPIIIWDPETQEFVGESLEGDATGHYE